MKLKKEDINATRSQFARLSGQSHSVPEGFSAVLAGPGVVERVFVPLVRDERVLRKESSSTVVASEKEISFGTTVRLKVFQELVLGGERSRADHARLVLFGVVDGNVISGKHNIISTV
jgi:hypothetical protein